jgi:hypothetical protein
MKVYYSKGWAVTFVIAGLILIGLNFILFNLTGKMEAVRIVPGVMVIVVGILYYFQPYFKLEEKSLVTYSLLGFVGWRYPFDQISDLTFKGNKLFLTRRGKLKRIRVSSFVCNKNDWEKFKLIIEVAEPGNELHE